MLISILLSCVDFGFKAFEPIYPGNDVDILFVLDNSGWSMSQEASALGQNFNVFINKLANQNGSGSGVEGLGDAVDDFVAYVTERGNFIDYQLAITTTTVDYTDAGFSDGLEPGEGGLLTGMPTILSRSESDVVEAFKKNLLCDATYWDSAELFAPENQDPDYDCDTGGDPEIISLQYLDCLCGTNGWDNPSGSEQEEPLEAALMALCRAEENPPDACYEIDAGTPTVFTDADIGTNDGFLRDGSTVVIVILGDEGDTSRRIPNGSADITPYLEAFEQFERTIKVVSLGPNLVPDDDGLGYSIPCNNGGSTDWAAKRLLDISGQTNGFYRYLEEEIDGECAISDFAESMTQLGELLTESNPIYRLYQVPVPSSIKVYVDGEVIYRAPISDETVTGVPLEYGEGWVYDALNNSVTFSNMEIGYDDRVNILYEPMKNDGPREFPFNY